MKFLCDVHIPLKLVRFLLKNGFESIHVNSILDKWYTQDKDICRFADEKDFIVVTKDNDFKNFYFAKNTPKKLIRLDLGNIMYNELVKIFESHLPKITESMQAENCFIEMSFHELTIWKSNDLLGEGTIVNINS